MKMKLFSLSETQLFLFMGYLKTLGGGGGANEPPLDPSLVV